MTNNLQQEKPALTTGPNPHSVRVGDYANQHTSPSGPAASNASNSKHRCSGTSNLCGTKSMALPNRGRGTERIREPASRLYRRLGLLHPRPTYYLIALLLFFPLASAVSIPAVSFQDAIIDGNFSATGLPQGLQSRSGADMLSFHLRGNYEVEVEYIDRIFNIGIGVERDSGTKAPVSDSGDAAVQIQKRGDILLDFTDSTGSLAGDSGSVRRSTGNQEWDLQFDQARTPPVVETHQTILQKINQNGEIFAQGNFKFSIWNANFTTQNNHYYAGSESGNDPLGIGQGRSQIIHVTVKNGSLQGTLPGGQVETYWATAQLKGLDSITLTGARGQAGQLLGTVKVEGNWEMRLDEGDAITASQIQANTAIVGGARIQQTTTWQWWLTAIPFLLLATFIIRPSSKKLVRKMEEELNQSKYELVAGHRTKRLLKSKHAGRASLYRATALLAMGAYQEAGLFLQSLTMQARPDAATYHLLNAHALSGIGSKDAAARELAACLALVPSYGSEASQIPLLAPLVGRAFALSPDYA